jgi:hypothetical protein
MKTVSIFVFGAALVVAGAAQARGGHMTSHPMNLNSSQTLIEKGDLGRGDNGDRKLSDRHDERDFDRHAHVTQRLETRAVELAERIKRLEEDLAKGVGNPDRIHREIRQLAMELKRDARELRILWGERGVASLSISSAGG